ncbi:hypothetical protein TIFTF001_003376 [Ficus carica]|uniref:Uncharacterized protein n=1 Tax=Ficus carica TaxID=3494 RepID=A0AA87Z8U7_FICCA|nr:hypothetical protein TIFTF001_003376 [Ficus carica]
MTSGKGSLPRSVKVKNKNPAPIQITAEQIIHEARELHRSERLAVRTPTRTIADAAELVDYRSRKREEFEDQIRLSRGDTRVYIRYARWEESQKDFRRVRSVWERALEVDHRNHGLWLQYAEFEMKNRFVNHARNVFERAVAVLPGVDRLWWRYIQMEETLGNEAGVRRISEMWTKLTEEH